MIDVATPERGDTIRWTEHQPGSKPRIYTGEVQTVHPDRWLVKVGPGKLHDLRRPAWEATGEIVASAPQQVLVAAGDDGGPACGWLQEPGTERADCAQPTGHSGACVRAAAVKPQLVLVTS